MNVDFFKRDVIKYCYGTAAINTLNKLAIDNSRQITK